jgi:hypothetical protein
VNVTALVVRRVRLTKPVDEVAEEIRQAFPPAFRSLPGFRSYYLSKVDAHGADIVMIWDTVADAERAANVIGPGVYADVIAPVLADDQPPTIGEAVVEFRAE